MINIVIGVTHEVNKMPELPASLKAVKRARTAVKGQITNSVNKLTKIFKAENFDAKILNELEVN